VRPRFAQGESLERDGGRFRREAQRIASILETARPGTVVILNETFSSTAAYDALDLAEELVAYLADARCSVLLATHLHDLPRRLRERGVPALSLAIGRSAAFRVDVAEPEGRSHARAVARAAGLDFERLRRALDDQ
jgi:DNA mismatch repair ATPase MutS